MAENPTRPARHDRRTKMAGLIGVLCTAVIIALVVGFFRFTSNLQNQAQLSDTKADAIVVLTGGTGRIKAGLNLLREKKGQRLLISGVYPATTSKQLIETNKNSKAIFDCCVDLGRVAENTIGNALEAADWASKNDYKSLILVTSAFHMPRTLIEFSNAMPSLKLIPHPVRLPKKNWWTDGHTTALLAREYSKLILSWVRTGLFPGTRTSSLANSSGL